MANHVECDERVMDVVADALQRPPEERELFVQQACNGDHALVCAVNEALAWEANNASFLNAPWTEFTRLVSPFTEGEVVLDRFEIVREIGEGGMGMVYEAFDRKLQQHFAIKAAKPGFQRLLSPELRSALKVSHHNICRENEIHTTQTEWGEIDFLTMEFLDGETLSAHLKETGKLSQDESLDIACQLCAGLIEAHQSGIIHRDLKSGNVMLCQNEDGSRRAVITDFGLAGPSSSSGEMAGTPAYMAPELWRGEPASKLSDIYALGVILYEMVAGRRPYQREDDAKLGRQKTVTLAGETVSQAPDEVGSLIQVTQQEWEQPEHTRPPLPPSAWTRGLDPRWDRVIMGCLEVDPAERTQDVGEVLTELRRKRIPKWPFATAGIVVLVLAAAIGLIRPLRLWVTDMIWPPNVRLAVMPYDGPKELAAIGSGALQEAAERIQQLPTERKWPLNKLSRSVAVIPPSRLAYLHVQTPEQARDLLHASHAMTVKVHQDAAKVTAIVSMLDLKSHIVVKELTLEYTGNKIGAMPAALAHLAAMSFRLREPELHDQLSAAAKGPYLKGVYFLNRDIHSFDEAMEQFQQAARLDPNSALPPAGMAVSLVQKYMGTGQTSYIEQAQQYVRNAQGRNPDSIPVLLASGRVNEANNQYNKALQDYRRVQQLQPRNIEVLQRLGIIYEQLEEPDESVAAFHQAQELDPDYYRSYQLLGEFYSRRGQYSLAADQFAKTVALAAGFFDGWSSLGGVLIELGRFQEAEDALQHSLKLRETALALNNMGALMAFQERYDEAATYQKRALVLHPNSYLLEMNVADNLRWGGHKGEAASYYGHAREHALEDVRSDPKSAESRAFFAYFSARLGDTARAEEEISEAVNMAPGDNDVLRMAVLVYELLGKRGVALDALPGMSLAQLKRLTREPDLADFCQDPRFKQQMLHKEGGQ